MDFRHAYHEHQTMIRSGLRAARSAGKGWVSLAGSSTDPRKLSDRQIELLALRDAELIVNLAINQHNEQLARTGR